MSDQRITHPRRAQRSVVAGAFVAVIVATGFGVWTERIPILLALGVAAVVAAAFFVSERLADGSNPPLDIAGLAATVDAHRVGGALRTPMAAIVIELRGVAADTIVDGAAAWAEPIAVIGRRLASAEAVEYDIAIARLGAHTFGAVVQTGSRDDALLAAQSLVSLCRVPVRTAERELRIDAVAGVSQAEAGDRCTGEELIRAADASLRVDQRVASPIVAIDRRLKEHARRIIAVENEIRRSLDTDLLTARLVPIIDVHRDTVVGLRTAYDWTSISRTDPEILGSVADAMGLRRAIETQYLMRSIAAAEAMPADIASRRVIAAIDAHRLGDPRAVSQISLLLRVCGLDPSDLVLELDCWTATSVSSADVRPLRDLGVGIGVQLGHHGSWDSIPTALDDGVDSVSVEAVNVIHPDGAGPALGRIEALRAMLGRDLSIVTVRDVNNASVALELSAAGLPLQSGHVHGAAMDTARLHDWIIERQR